MKRSHGFGLSFAAFDKTRKKQTLLASSTPVPVAQHRCLPHFVSNAVYLLCAASGMMANAEALVTESDRKSFEHICKRLLLWTWGMAFSGGLSSVFVFLIIEQSADTSIWIDFLFVIFLLMFMLYFFLFISQLAVLFGPRVVLTLDSAGVAIDVLTIGWEEIGSIERVYQSRRALIGDPGWRPCSRKRITYLDKLTIVPLDERCAARWKESWHLRSRPLGQPIEGVSASGVVLTRFHFPTSIEQLDESLRELYGVFHGGELRVKDTWLVRKEGCVEPFELPTSSTLPAAAADPPAIAIPAIVLERTPRRNAGN